MPQPRVLLGFAAAEDHQLEELAGEVHTKLYASAHFPSPPATAVELLAALNAFRDAQSAQESTGTEGTALKEQTRATLIGLLRQLAAYVQLVMMENPAFGLAELLSSGFDAASTNRTQHPLAPPSIFDIKNVGEGTVSLRVTPSPNARMYEVQRRVTGTDTWEPGGMYASTRGLLVTGLTPGALYDFRIRALGGSTGQSEWSNPVSRRSL